MLGLNVGIAERRVVDDETTSDMCTAAARQALERADLAPVDVDLIILGTDTPDYISPATAAIVQHKLGALNSGTFDINSACASWIAGVDVSAKQIAVDTDINNVLVVGGYAMTRFLDYHDKRTCTLFGDGAGAVVMSVCDEPGYLASKLISKGQYYKTWGIYTGGAASPVNNNALNRPVMQFLERFPTTFNNDNWPPIIHQTVAKQDWPQWTKLILSFHPVERQYHQRCYATAKPTNRENPLDNGQMGLYRCRPVFYGSGRCTS